ncbi:outer membrane protein transport protein [Microbulbifer sp. MLAF003]|uniref:outer membrane protein transport protein n=1 Tax=Microbulbifer sp. MLAF003 TaxID=3032582 RepID=UPI0024AC8B2F|nr:outer membrane protein transport protein [Microbulbifer sp. MLAF003]WHI50139.1 outer membrane protein transport protein [Microbulbifer sp. MLAF003]
MNKKYLRHAVLAAAIGSVSQGAMAAGFYLQETSASGLGRAFAAENTIGDNASILARNPAGSALFDTYTISGGLTYVDPNIDVSGDVTYFGPIPGTRTTVRADADDYATSAWIPNGYLAAPINDEWSWGLAMYTDFGLETDFPDSFPAAAIANQTELLTVNIQPSIAYDINNTFSIGASINFLYADATLKTNIPTDFVLDPIFSNPAVLGRGLSGASVLKIEGDGWDVSWTLGALWRISDNTRAGISYHAKYDPKLKGDVSSDLIPPPAAPFDDTSGNLTLDLPDTLELGFYHRFDNQWAVAVGYMWTNWEEFERLEAFIPSAGEGFNPLLIKEENFKSGSRFSLAGEYFYNDDITVRFGYAYDQGAARDGFNRHEQEEILATTGLDLPITWRTLSIPDTDRQWLTLGGTYQYNEKLSVDAGIAYIWGDDERIQEYTPIPVPTYYDGGTTKTEAWLFSAAINYRF